MNAGTRNGVSLHSASEFTDYRLQKLIPCFLSGAMNFALLAD